MQELLWSFFSNALASLEQSLKKSFDDRSTYIEEVASYIIFSGGKRMRPLLTFVGYALNSPCEFFEPPPALMHLATSVELIHTATLLHDDVVDEACVRRFKRAAHHVFGNKASILVGDFLFAQAFFNMVKTGSLDVLGTLSNAARVIAEGEVMQLRDGYTLDLSFDQYWRIIGAKTATLFAAAALSGGELAGNLSLESSKALWHFGYELGIGFQILDDILDYIGTLEFLGKMPGADFRERKIGLPLLLSNMESPEFWKSHFVPEKFEQALVFMKRQGVFETCKEHAKAHLDEAKKYLSVFEKSNLLESIFLFVDTLLERKA